MNLFELTQEWKDLQALLLDDEIERSDIESAFGFITEQRNLKLENCLKMIKTFDAMEQGIAYEIMRLEAHKKRTQRAGEQLRDWVKMNLQPGEKFECTVGAFGWRKSEAVVSENEETPIPDAYAVVKMVTTPDKKLMKKDLECGATIPGWTLEKRTNLAIK